MTNIVIVLLFFVSMICFVADHLSARRSNFLYILVVIGLILVSGLRNGDAMPDFATYSGFYSQIVNGQFLYFIEISFVVIAKLANLIVANNVTVLFFIYAFIGVVLKANFIHKVSSFGFYSLAIYVSNYFILHEMIQIRAGVATGFILLSLACLRDRFHWKFIGLILCASLFHYSSLVFLFLWFLRKDDFSKRLSFYVIPLAYLLHFLISQLNVFDLIIPYIPFSGLAAKLSTYSQSAQDDVLINVFGLFVLTRVIILLYFTYFSSLVQRRSDYFHILLKAYVLGIFIYIAFASYPYIAVRIATTLLAVEVIIIPTLIYTIKGYFLPRLLVISYAALALFLNINFTSYFYGGVQI